jgi:hypothetical protein
LFQAQQGAVGGTGVDGGDRFLISCPPMNVMPTKASHLARRG